MKDEPLSIKHLTSTIVFIYAFFSSFWILSSDWLLMLLTSDLKLLTQLQTLKGWAFVILTSGLIYALVERGLRSLKASYTLFSAVIQGTTDAIFVKNLEGRYLMINSAGASALGRAIEDVIGKDDTELLAPDIAHKIKHEDNKVLSSGKTQVYEDVLPLGQQERTYLSTKYIYRNSEGNPIGLIGIARDITERKQLLEELKREKEDLAALGTVTAKSFSTLNLEELLDGLLQRVVEVMGADAAFILLKKENHLYVRASVGIDEVADSNYTVRLGQCFAGTIAARMQPMYVEDAQSDFRVINRSLKQCGIRTMLGVPLERNGELAGVLHVDWLSIHPESDRERYLLEITAERCTMAILNAQLYQHSLQLQELLQLQFDHMPLGCIVNDQDLHVMEWNAAAEKIFGFTKADVLGKNPCDLITPPAVRSHVADIFRQLTAGEMTVQSVNENITKDGRTIICEWYNTPLKAADGTVIGMLSMAQDITERQISEQELRRKDELYRTLARNFPNGAVFLFDRDLRYTLAEGAEIKAMGLSSEAFEGKTLWEALSSEICEMLEPVYRQALAGSPASFEAPYGDRVYLVQVLPVTNTSGEIYAGMAVTQDITERKLTEAQLWRYAFYDSLTSLPNRTLFLERVEQLLQRAKHDETPLFAVLLLQLDRFEIVKYSLGHLVADQLMMGTAQRLEACVRPTDLIARLGSDEFAILLRNLKDISDANRIAERIHQELTLPFNLEGREVFSTTSIGIALCGNRNRTDIPLYERSQDLLRAADMAMHHAKKQGLARHAVFDPAMQEQAVARLQMEADLRRAIERQQFQVHYQPIVSLETGRITGFEALVRWTHPTRGMVSPLEFIPLAEETGLIGAIDRWVLREACVQLSIWQQTFGVEVPLTMSVNLSGVQLAQLGLIERLDQILRETGIEGRCLKLEITESAIMENATVGTVMLEQLKTLGIQLSIDDFGTGYSSLARLHQLPIDTLKIDRSFISRMGNDGESLEIVRAIITLAHSLAMDVIAEGAETPQELEQLRSLQCEYGQGYFFSKPVNSQAAEKLLAAHLQW